MVFLEPTLLMGFVELKFGFFKGEKFDKNLTDNSENVKSSDELQ